VTERTQTSIMEEALRRRRAAEADAPAHPQNVPTASQGAIRQPRADQPPRSALDGALDAEGQRPVLERSRKVR
jgi:hypothetical protein